MKASINIHDILSYITQYKKGKYLRVFSKSGSFEGNCIGYTKEDGNSGILILESQIHKEIFVINVSEIAAIGFEDLNQEILELRPSHLYRVYESSGKLEVQRKIEQLRHVIAPISFDIFVLPEDGKSLNRISLLIDMIIGGFQELSQEPDAQKSIINNIDTLELRDEAKIDFIFQDKRIIFCFPFSDIEKNIFDVTMWKEYMYAIL